MIAKTKSTEIISSSGKSYNFNINEKMNDLNLKSLLLTGQLKAGGDYDKVSAFMKKGSEKMKFKENLLTCFFRNYFNVLLADLKI